MYFVHCMCLYIFLQLFVRRIVPQILLGIMRHRNVHYYYYHHSLSLSLGVFIIFIVVVIGWSVGWFGFVLFCCGTSFELHLLG